MPKLTSTYKVIAIYGGTPSGENAISSIDGTPGYLHIHIIRKDIFDSLPVIQNNENKSEDGAIYQFGAALDKTLSTRSPVASVQDIISYGNIGLGSAAKYENEENSSFSGGGEVFIVPCENGVKAFRVTKGQKVIAMNLEDRCWTCEIADNKSARSFSVANHQISNRQELLEALQNISGVDKAAPFISCFDAQFEKDCLAVRSNGIFSSDEVKEKDTSLFTANESEPLGGHLLGDSKSDGDQINKHKGNFPKSEARVSLVILDGKIEIIPIKKRLIALKENPHEFREALMQVDLQNETFHVSETHKPVIINGGGLAGTITAIKFAKAGIPSTIIERREKLMSETSGCTPGRIGHGYHYRDLETAKIYLQSSITFIKEYCDKPEKIERLIISVSRENPEIDFGLYFIPKDSQVPAAKLLEVYEGIRNEYRKLVEIDPSNKVFGEVEDFFRVLDLQDFKDVADIEKMDAVIRTNERLLNWQEFSRNLENEVNRYQRKGLISVINNEEVTKIEYDTETKNQNFALITKSGKRFTASYVVNATWSNIEMLDSDLFPESAVEDRTNRIKLIASIRLPNGKEATPSMFSAMGAYAMFSNEGAGKGKATYAPVTNFIDYVIEEFKKNNPDQNLIRIFNKWIDARELALEDRKNPESLRNIERNLDMQPLYKRWISQGLSAEEKLFFGEKILQGAVELYPALSGSTVTNVAAGIVKSNGEVNIRDANSNFHQRSDHGLKQRQIGYVDFNGVKLFYIESQARNVVQTIVSDVRSNIIMKRNAALESFESKNSFEEVKSDNRLEAQKEYWTNSYVRRYASNRALTMGEFKMLKQPDISTANHEIIEYIQKSLDFAFNSHLKQPQLSQNIFSQILTNIISPICSAYKIIAENTKSGSLDQSVISQQQTRIKINLNQNRNLFTVFSIIDKEGNIIVDGKYGALDAAKRREHEVPSLFDRDYVQKMLHRESEGFVCGNPVHGSTSHEYMIPAGFPINRDFYLTFGMPVDSLMRTLGTTRQVRTH